MPRLDKAPDAFRTISEVAELLNTPAHVLRFWEDRFTQIKPVKRAGGRRYYRPSDVALLAGIKHLLHHDGMTIRGVQKILREEGVRHVAGLTGDISALDLDEDYDPDQVSEADLAARVLRIDRKPRAPAAAPPPGGSATVAPLFPRAEPPGPPEPAAEAPADPQPPAPVPFEPAEIPSESLAEAPAPLPEMPPLSAAAARGFARSLDPAIPREGEGGFIAFSAPQRPSGLPVQEGALLDQPDLPMDLAAGELQLIEDDLDAVELGLIDPALTEAALDGGDQTGIPPDGPTPDGAGPDAPPALWPEAADSGADPDPAAPQDSLAALQALTADSLPEAPWNDHSPDEAAADRAVAAILAFPPAADSDLSPSDAPALPADAEAPHIWAMADPLEAPEVSTFPRTDASQGYAPALADDQDMGQDLGQDVGQDLPTALAEDLPAASTDDFAADYVDDFADDLPEDPPPLVPELAGLAARLRALNLPLQADLLPELAELHSRLGLVHAQMAEAQRLRR